MNEENDLDHNVEAEAVKVPVDCVRRDDVVQASNEVKGKSLWTVIFYH